MHCRVPKTGFSTDEQKPLVDTLELKLLEAKLVVPTTCKLIASSDKKEIHQIKVEAFQLTLLSNNPFLHNNKDVAFEAT